MKKIFGLLIVITSILFLLPLPAFAQTLGQTTPEPYAGEMLCPPDVYLEEPQDCLPLGPSADLTDMARMGISYPETPLPSQQPDPSLAEIPYTYIHVTQHGPVPVHTSVEDGLAQNVRRSIPNGFRYFSYSDRQETLGGVFYLFNTGEWIEGSFVSRVSPPTFLGYLFSNSPTTQFGWILDIVETKTEPMPNAPNTGNTLNRFDVVHVYNSKKVGETEWYMINANEWVEKSFLAIVQPNPTPPTGVGNGRWIELNLYQQTLMVYEQNRLIFATMVSSGLAPFYTKPGLFQIYEKLPAETMSSGNLSDYYYLEDVPWTMYYDEERALHGAYWHSMFGYPRSHGCVNLSIADARWLYDWAQVGDWVYVWDPSGNTPTDPSFYSQSAGP